MTASEARAAAIADGIQDEQITPEILRFYGYVPGSPTAGQSFVTVIAPDQVKSDLEALNKEAQANSLPGQIGTQLKSVLGWIKGLGIGVVLAIVLVGCGPSQQAVHSVDQAAASVQALNEQHLRFEEQFIQAYKTKETARIQELYEASMASSTQPVVQAVRKVVRVPVKAADGSDAFKEEAQTVQETVVMVPLNVAEALNKQRVRLLQEMNQNVILMRTQQAQICGNAANAVAYLEGLKAYFQQRQVTYESLLDAEKSLFDFLGTFIKKDGK